ncbi:hypothetical protein RhiirA4_480149 [Rhizophagus irregularis]|uniref:MULE transposase domain-containing protein n=1 Tax=Rhizophagus irregularis TaxID=588596 RepID=A0A2I1HHG4_9GLOM|nr:hypothetical protein RhiirA4_480149 [Rhizophagus irregularis]
MLQDILNLLIFDIDNKQEIYDDKNMNYDTSFLQFSFQHLYDFNNEFRNNQNDYQLINSQIKDLSVQQMYDLNNEFRNDHQLSDISEQLEDFTIDDKEQENHDVNVNISSLFSVRPSYLNSKRTEGLELKTGLNFSSWQEFNIWIDDFAKIKGFNYKVRSSQMDEKTSNIVKINSFIDDHNHILTSQIQKMASRFWKLTPEILSDIKKYDLYNAVYQFWLNNNLGDSDASQMLQMLLNQKESDLLWIVKPRLEPSSRKLNYLLWMSPHQRFLYDNFHNVVILDTTSNTNWFQMMLCVIIVIDNHFKTKIVTSAIIKNEILDTFRWILITIFEETDINPGVIFTDSDPSIIGTIKEIHLNTNHLLCIFYIDLNLCKKLKSKLGVCFEEFRNKFYACQNSLCKELFESRWTQLINQYLKSAKYMSNTLYVNKESGTFHGYATNSQLMYRVSKGLNQLISKYMIGLKGLLHYVI